MKERIYENVTIVKLPKSEIEITGAVPAAIFSAYRPAALKNVNAAVKIDGFRNGNVPEKVLVAKVGERTILEEMAELALSDAYPAIVLDHKLDPVARPEVSITKMASGNPLEFKIRTAVMPEVSLGDYKKAALEIPTIEIQGEKDAAGKPVIEDKEVDEALARIKKSHEGHDHGDHGHDHSDHTHADFDTPEFRQKIREALADNKRREALEKRRIAISDKIVETATIDVPAVLVSHEIDRIERQFKDDISRMNVNLDDYLKHAQKSLEDIRKEWLPHAEKKAKLELVLNKIAEIENIKADEKEIETEVNHILEHYKDADRERTYAYAAGVLTNEKVFQFLEHLGNDGAKKEEK